MNEMERQQAEPFRRRRFEAPHRRRHPLLRLVRPLVAAIAAVGVPAGLFYWVLTSPQLQIRELAVTSAGRVAPAWVEDRLEPLLGRHLLPVGLPEVARRLADHPWIADVLVRRALPGRLEVTVGEKRPVALWNEAGDLFYVDGSGTRIAPWDADFGAVDLPVISAQGDPSAAGARAVALIAEWERLRPGDPVSQIEVLESGDFRLVTATLPFALLLSADRLAAAPRALELAAPVIDRRYGRVTTVDLRFSRQIVFQPAAPPPLEEG